MATHAKCPEVPLFQPNPRQEEFMISTSRHVGYGGSRGGGKSWAMRTKFVLLSLNFQKLKLLLLRRTLPELRENHIIPLLELLSGGLADWKETEKVFIFPSTGSRLKLGYCDIENDIYQYQGQEYDVIGLEEATLFTEAQKDFITTCNRNVRSDFKPRMYYTGNPGGVGHAWFKRLFIERDYRNSEQSDDYVFIPAKVYDNQILMKNNPEYIQSLKNLPEDLRRAHLDGDWNVFAGQMFSDFKPDIHVIEPFEIPKEWRRIRSIDYGYNDYTAVYWAAINDQHVYVYRELHVRLVMASELCKMIKEQTGSEQVHYTVASPDMWQRRGTDGFWGETVAETFIKSGVPVVQADNSRVQGWQRLHEYLALAPDGKPYLQICRNCKFLIRHLPQLIYDEHKTEDASSEPHDITNSTDSLRYLIMSRPRPNKEIPRSNYIPGGMYLRAELRANGLRDWEISKLIKTGKIKLIGK